MNKFVIFGALLFLIFFDFVSLYLLITKNTGVESSDIYTVGVLLGAMLVAIWLDIKKDINHE